MIFGKGSAPRINVPAPPNWQNTYEVGDQFDKMPPDILKKAGATLDADYILKHQGGNSDYLNSTIDAYHYKNGGDDRFVSFKAPADASDSEAEMNKVLEDNAETFIMVSGPYETICWEARTSTISSMVVMSITS
jgi:hypothetical protein